MKTKCVRPVLVESKEITGLWKDSKGLIHIARTLTKGNAYDRDGDWTPQELILISLEDEKIEESDWYCYLSYKGDYKLKQYNEEKHFNEDPCVTLANLKAKRVIARQSQISPEYISKFIEQYNNGCVEDLEIEMERLYSYEAADEFDEVGFCGFRPKLTKDGYIDILKHSV